MVAFVGSGCIYLDLFRSRGARWHGDANGAETLQVLIVREKNLQNSQVFVML